MSLYAIGDLHLHFQSELKARNQIRDRVWKNHEEKFVRYCSDLIREDDTLVLAGDHSWGKNLESAAADLEYICNLPGRKILLRGNHDMFWDAKKTAALNEKYAGRISFLQDNYYAYKDYALIGTKGYCFEGPFYLDGRGRIVDWDEREAAHAKKLVQRECVRLEKSFEAARADGYEKFIMFLHYPPTNIMEDDSPFTQMAEHYGVGQVIYAHCHGQARFDDSIRGIYHGICYSLVSGDYLKWHPLKVMG